MTHPPFQQLVVYTAGAGMSKTLVGLDIHGQVWYWSYARKEWTKWEEETTP